MDLVELQSHEGTINRHPWELSRFYIIKQKVQNLIGKYNNDKNIIIIDIGCGDAYVIKRLCEELNLNQCYGIDINFEKAHLDYLNSAGSRVSFYQNLNDCEFNSENNYIVLLNDVIEHIEHDVDFLKDLNDKLKPLNHVSLFITVPAFQFLFSNHDVDLGHFRRYNLNKLLKYNDIVDIPVVTKGYFFLSLYVARLISKIFEGPVDHNRSGVGVGIWKGGKLITMAMKYFLIFDYTIINLLNKINLRIPGLSVYVIYSK